MDVPARIEDAFPRPSVVGILNVTPDSFFDGGNFLDPDLAVARAHEMIDEGAAIVDIGGESTRPGSMGVSLDEELARVVPVLERLEGLPLSIDTSRAEVARRAIELGAVMVNDVTALRRDPGMAEVVAGAGVFVCLMHMLGEPRTMQQNPQYADVVSEVATFLAERVQTAVEAGIDEERICIDPGIGFGKSVDHNLELIARLDEIARIGRPVMIGASRKRFLGRISGDPEATQGSVSASVAISVLALERGASLFRVHDVGAHVEALATTEAMVGAHRS